MREFDIQIRGGLLVDGTRAPAIHADVWIADGRIRHLGRKPLGTAKKVIDAEGLIVAPGFIDLHTHYDAQIRWDPWCSTSGWHGVTSVVLGNCGFGFAPCRPGFRERSMQTMTRNEAIPFSSLREGLLPHWDWETIPEYLDSLDRAAKGVNAIQYLPTASLMTYVMGLSAAKERPASAEERSEIRRLFHEGMDAGLCGFSIQRLGPDSNQRDFDGTPMVTDTMSDEDIFNLAEVLRERGEGFIQIVQGLGSDEDLAFEERLAAVAQRPIIHNAVVAGRKAELHKRGIEWLAGCWDRGLQIYGQAGTLRSGFAVTLEDWNLYDASPAWREATLGTKADKIAKLSDPAIRAGLISDAESAKGTFELVQALTGGPIDRYVVHGVNRQPELQEYVGKSVGQIAAEEGKHPIEALLDLSLRGDLNVEFLPPERGDKEWPATNFADMILDSPYTVPGISDGGAHTKFFNGGSFTTDFLRWLVHGEKLIPLEEAHYRLSALPAKAAGFRDRGTLAEGAAADVVVYDPEALNMEPSWIGEVVHDFPGGEWRRIQRAIGYRSIIVNGVETFADGTCTGATPGRLLRHGRG